MAPSKSSASASTIGRCNTVPTADLLLALRQGSHPPGPGPILRYPHTGGAPARPATSTNQAPVGPAPRDCPVRRPHTAQVGAAKALPERDDLREPHHPAAEPRARKYSAGRLWVVLLAPLPAVTRRGLGSGAWVPA